jgi:predicted phosphodiesterase
MKTAIISDVHANLEALTSCLRSIEKNQADEIVCLGDLVGYGANPRECTNKARRACKQIIAGNHDHAAAGVSDTSYFNEYARRAVLWTTEQVSDAEIEFFKELPLTYSTQQYTLVHGSPKRPEEWDYVLTLEQAKRQFKSFNTPLCFFGHSHIPGAFEYDGTTVCAVDCHVLRLVAGRQYLYNVGSVGQPRDSDPRSAYAIYDDSAQTVSLIRVSYDVEKAQKKIRDAGLPAMLADRLSVGR